MSTNTKLTICGVIIILAVVMYFWRGSESESAASWTDYNASLRCRSCSNDFNANLDVDQEPPFTCPKCGDKEAWHLKQCRNCGEIFLPPLEGDPPWPPMIATCPKCKSQATGAYVADQGAP